MKEKKSDLSVLVTGGTRGIGLEMAREFLKKGHKVTICGRSVPNLNEALGELSAYESRLLGVSCDVTDIDQVERLWKVATERFKTIDIWINNAGISHLHRPIWEIAGGEVKRIINVNISGAIYGSQVAMLGMLDQGYGAIYNMEGWGSNGRHMDNMNIYGTTKAAIRYFTDGLVEESKGLGVLVGRMNPGMVVTDLLLEPLKQSPDHFARTKKIMQIIADRPDTVARYLVSKILANRTHGAYFSWLNSTKLFFRFLTAPFIKRNIGL